MNTEETRVKDNNMIKWEGGKEDYQLRMQKVGGSGHSEIFRAHVLSTELLVLPLSHLTPWFLLLTNCKLGLSHGRFQLLPLIAGRECSSTANGLGVPFWRWCWKI